MKITEMAGVYAVAPGVVLLLALGCQQEEVTFNEKSYLRGEQRSSDSEAMFSSKKQTQGDLGDSSEDADRAKNSGAPRTRGESRDNEVEAPVSRLVPKITREKTFLESVIDSVTLRVDFDGVYTNLDLVMKRLYYDKVATLNQVVRPVIMNQFQQGNRGVHVEESFDQVADRLLDILIVMDNSSSMLEEQFNLSSRLMPLLKHVEVADWQIGVVTTDPGDTCLVDLIKKGDPDVEDKFRRAVTQGIHGSTNERGILTAVTSLRGDCLVKPWLREGSSLAVLIVSDEDNCSDGTECPGKDYASDRYLYDYLGSIRLPKSTAHVHGLIWHPSHNQLQCLSGAYKGNIYAKVIADTGGTWGSICDLDYTPTLEAISRNIRVTLNHAFTLADVPEPGTLKVMWGAVEVTQGFVVHGKVIDFSVPPPEGVKVVVEYQKGPATIETTFTLSARPVEDQMEVLINDQPKDPASYTINADKMQVTFLVPPPEASRIDITFTKDVPLSKIFALDDGLIKTDSLRVEVNGVEETAVSLVDGLGTVEFDVPPEEGAEIVFSYKEIGPEILSYPFAPKLGNQGLLAFDRSTGEELQQSYADGFVTFVPSAFLEDRVVTIRYENLSLRLRPVDLPHTPLPGSVSAIAGQEACSTRLSIVGSQVAFDGCGFPPDTMELKIRYDTLVSEQQTFTFDGDDLPGPADFQEWSVFINDQETKDFRRLDNVITIEHKLPPAARVKIQLVQKE